MRSRISHVKISHLKFFFFVSLLFALLPEVSWAHGIAGKRFFPTTLLVDDPFMSDEFSILFNHIKQPGAPPARLNEITLEYSKRITPNFGIMVNDSYSILDFTGDGQASGFGNLGLAAKYQFLTDPIHETILSFGVDSEIGGTGSHEVSGSFSTISPTFFFGKGMGDLPESAKYLRPIAITGTLGASFPTRSKNIVLNAAGEPEIERNPVTFNWALAIQYSFMYLQSFVKDIGLGVPFNRSFFVVEFPMETCLSGDCGGKTTGTIDPGFLWAGRFFELGIAAEIPINSDSGKNVGILGLVHLFLDDIFPKSLGRPVFTLK